MNETVNNVFTATGYNRRGQITGYNLGNGLSTTRGYDDFGFVTSIYTAGIQNDLYEFNTLTGNLNRRKDVDKNLLEDFTYDTQLQSRLETWKVAGHAADSILYAGAVSKTLGHATLADSGNI